MTSERVGIAGAASRLLMLPLTVLAGLVAIVGSGGGFSDCPDPNGCGAPPPWPPIVSLSPRALSVQVGSPATFTSDVSSATAPIYAWCARRSGAPSCVPISGATGPSYTFAAVNLADDGTFVQMTATNGAGSASAGAILRVSSMPAVVFQDGEFPAANWSSVVIAQSPGGSTYTEYQAGTGGNPGAFWLMRNSLAPGPSSMTVFHSAPFTYAPAAMGAIHAIDLNVDCEVPAATSLLPAAWVMPMFVQSGRWYVPTSTSFQWFCFTGNWRSATVISLVAGDFGIGAGPACGPAEQCPDFSTAGAALTLGYGTTGALNAPAPAQMFDLAIDNWKVSVWRP